MLIFEGKEISALIAKAIWKEGNDTQLVKRWQCYRAANEGGESSPAEHWEVVRFVRVY